MSCCFSKNSRRETWRKYVESPVHRKIGERVTDSFKMGAPGFTVLKLRLSIELPQTVVAMFIEQLSVRNIAYPCHVHSCP